MGRYSVPPLLAVGYEGFFGTISVLILMPLLPLIKLPADSPAAGWFDLVRGWHQLIDTPSVLYSGIVVACSISLFNYFGLSVTKYVSATARSLTDTCRTLAIWIVSLLLGWEILMWPISLLQVAGFGLLVYGTVRSKLGLGSRFHDQLTTLSSFSFCSTTSYNHRRSYAPRTLRQERKQRMRHFCLVTCWRRRHVCLPTLAQADSMSCPQKDRVPLAAGADTDYCSRRWASNSVGRQVSC